MSKPDMATARRQMKSPNIKTRKHALRVLHEAKRQASRISIQQNVNRK